MNIVALVEEVHELLDRMHVRHAFGGALALAYYAEPRATIDVDVNVFALQTEAERVVAGFAATGLVPVEPPERWLPIAGVRLMRPTDSATLDLFFSLDGSYDEIADRAVSLPFGPTLTLLPFLSPEDLVLFKLSSGRAKDWVDLRALCSSSPHLDLDYVERQLLTLRGPTLLPRIVRLRALLREQHPSPSDG